MVNKLEKKWKSTPTIPFQVPKRIFLLGLIFRALDKTNVVLYLLVKEINYFQDFKSYWQNLFFSHRFWSFVYIVFNR